MMFSTRPEGKDMLEGPREIISRVSIDGLEQSESDPNVHGEDVEVLSEEAVEKRASEGSGSKDEDFSGVGVFSSEAEGGRVLVVDLVDMLIEGAVMEHLVSNIVEEVLKDEEECNLRSNGAQGRQGNLVGRHAESLSQGMEQPNGGELDSEMREQDTLGTFPLLSSRRNLGGLKFPFPEVGDSVDDDPRNATTKVDNLVKKERH